MPNIAVNLTGQVFGRLTVSHRVGSKHGKSLWHCICRCGSTTEVLSTSLTRKFVGNRRYGGTQTCGKCEDSVKYPKEYQVWKDMRGRCLSDTHPSYSYYGGRGITICQRWLVDFFNFLEDMGPCPPELSLERVDNNGNYCKENCTWSTWSEQMKNRRHHNQYDQL